MRRELSIAGALVLATANALPEISLSRRAPSGVNTAEARRLLKRGGTISTNIYDIETYSDGGAYYANITVGTPPQNQVVIIDTGSSDLYFDASNASSCQDTTAANSCRGGTFNSANSKTFNIVDPSPSFNTSFGDGSTAVGPFGEDVIGIGDVMISNVQFGVAEEVNSTSGYAVGLMGVGYSENEATLHVYPNIPEVLRDTGVINSRLYSVYLNDVGEISGNILFGGIDTTKYKGELVTFDLLPTDINGDNTNTIDQFITTVTDLSVTMNGDEQNVFAGGTNSIASYTSQDTALAVLLDTGSSAWSMPQNYYNAIAKLFTFVDSHGFCPCSHQNDDITLTLTMGGKLNITVPAREFIVPIYYANNNTAVPYTDTDNACAFMLNPSQPTGEGFQPMGDAMLRSMYLVYDLDNGQVSIAQSNVNSTETPNIVTISAGPSGIAQAISSSYSPAPTNTWSIAPLVQNATGSFTVSTAQSTIGDATGTAAVPADAQIGASSSGSSSSGSSKSSGAAAGLTVPGMDWSGVWVAGVAVGMGALGAGLML